MLEACIRGATQNTNESFHNVFWAMVRKTQFCSLTTLRIALNLDVAKYNLGFVAGVSRCFVAITGLEAVSSHMMFSYTGLDPDKVEHSAWRIREVQKRRKHLAMLRTRKEEKAIEAKGGVRYGPG